MKTDIWPPLAEVMFGATTWCARCNRTTLTCRNAGDCHAPEPLPSSGVAGADRFFGAAECRHTGEIMTIGPHGKCRDCGARGPFHEPAYVGHCYATPDGRVVHEAEPRVTGTASAPLTNESRTP